MSGVLITRPQPQSVNASTRLKAAGFEVFEAPLLDIVPVSWALPEVVPQAVLLTSANAVAALAASTLPRDIRILAVGNRTAAAAAAAGFSNVESAAGDASALADLVLQRCGHGLGALLHLAGEAVAGNLAARLGQAGYWVETRIVYKANASTAFPDEVKTALANGTIRDVLLYSPRSAAIFSRLLGALPQRASLGLVCLSPAVAAAAGDGWRHVAISLRPDEESLLQILLQNQTMV